MNISDKFLQSKEFDLIVPQIQFIFRVWDILVVEQRRVRKLHIVQKTGDWPGAVLGEDVDMPVCVQRQGGSDTAETVLVPPVQFIDKGSSRCELAAKVPAFFLAGTSELVFCPFQGRFSDSVHLDVESWLSADFFGEPSMTKSSSSSTAQGWRGRRESDSQVLCRVYN